MVGPVVLRAFEVGGGADDVGALGAVVEGLGGHVGEVPEAVPLGAALGIGVPKVIVGDVFGEGSDLVLEGLAGEARGGGVVEREAGWLCEQLYWRVPRAMGWKAYFKLTISPDSISDLAAALIRVGVRRFNRPIWSFSPQTQHVCTSLGALAGWGISLRAGNFEALGSKGMVVADMLPVRKSLTWPRRA